MLSVVPVIVNYRSAALVAALMESLVRLADRRIVRVVIVDNASGDASVETLRAKARQLGAESWVTIVDAGRNGGFGAGNNAGAREALKDGSTPDLLWFLNPDTLVDGLDLASALAWFESDDRVGIVGTGMVDAEGRADQGGHRDLRPMGEFVRNAGSFGVLRRYAVSDAALDRPGEVDWVSGASLMMRTTAYQQLAGFDEAFFLYFEEIDLCRRARGAGWRVIYEPRTRIVHLEGQTTGVRTAKSRPAYWYQSRRRYFVKHFGVLGLLSADVAWGAGRLLRAVRGLPPDACRLKDVWKHDAPVIIGGRGRLETA